MTSPVIESRGRSSKLQTIPKAALIVAFLLAGFNILFAATGHLLSLVFAFIPLMAGIGIMRRKAWSAYGFALFETTQLLLTPVLLLRSGNPVSTPRPTILLSVALTVGSIALFVFAGRSLSASGSPKGHATPWIAAAVLVTAPFLFLQAFAVPTGAMEDTLLIGDKILVRVFPKTKPVDGDIIAFIYLPDRQQSDRRQIYIKRVIGIPGDRISISRRTVYRNGRPLSEPYAVHRFPPTNLYGENFPAEPDARAPIQKPARQMLAQNVVNGQLVVPPGKYFVLGDNRENSFDSRYWGFVDPSDIIGKPLLIYDSERPSMQTPPANRTLGWSRIRWHRLFKFL